LPFEPLSRRISLVARRDVLGDMPGDMAARLRGLLSEMIVDPATQKLPWLAGQLRVLG
jgi:hypothetical protein